LQLPSFFDYPILVQSSKQQDSVLMSGDLEIIVRQINTQKILRTIRIKNTITFEGTSSLVRLLAQDGVVLTDYQIDTLKVGSNGTPPTRGNPRSERRLLHL
jgi:hypothetical protein